MSVVFGPGYHVAEGAAVDATAYYRYVGRWSALFVRSLLEAARVQPGDRVLDVASGPGVAATHAVAVVGETGLVVGIDIAPGMLVPVAGATRVVADGQALPFLSGSVDAVVCQLGLQFFPMPEQGVAEFRRVLRHGGWSAVCVIAAPDRAPMWGFLADALSRELPAQEEQLHLSFVLADENRLERMFRVAGFSDVQIKRVSRRGPAERFSDYWAGIESGAGSLPQAYRALSEGARTSVKEEVRKRLAPYESGGRLIMSLEVLIACGRA